MDKKYKILAVDDEQIILDAFKRILTGEDILVDTTLSAKEALKLLAKEDYALILCDIMMPDMDGFEFLEELENKKIKTPVIMTTGFSTVETAVKSLKNGAICFIPKPFTIDEIMGGIYRGIEYYKIQQELIKQKTDGDNSTVLYVPCPLKYYRFGLNSWVNKDNEGSIFIGVTDLYVKTVKGIKQINLKSVNENLIQGRSCAELITTDSLANFLLSPISGKIINVNEELLNDFTLIEKDPYFKGWLYRVIPSNLEIELDNLTPCSTDRI